MTDESLTRRVGISSLWTIGTRFLVQILSLVSMVLLARWLGPTEMGLFEKAAIILGLLDMLSVLGVENALLQRQDLNRSHYDTAWTLNNLRGAVMALALILLAPVADQWFATTGLGALLPWIALQPLVQGFENIGMVDARRNLNFRIEFWWMVGRRLVSFIFGVALAWWLRSVWALIIASGITAFVSLALSYGLSSYRPSWTLSAWADLRKFVSWYFSYTTLAAIAARFEELLLLRFAAPADTAFFRRAQEFSGLPTTEIGGPMARALMPGLARLQHDTTAMRALFIHYVALAMILSLPLCVGLAVLAGPVVQLLLGPAWSAVAPLLVIMALSGIFRLFAAFSEVAYLATGNGARIFRVVLYSSLLRAPLLVFGILRGGIYGLTLAYVGASLISTIFNLHYLRATGAFRVREALASFWRPAIAATVMGVCVFAIGQSLQNASVPMHILMCALTGAAIYAFTLLACWQLAGRPDGAESMLMTQTIRLFKR